MELILLLIIIINVVRIVKKNGASTSKGRSTPSNDPYSQIPPPKKSAPSAQSIQRTVNQHLFGSASKPTDKYQLYKRFLEQDRYTDLAKLGHELGISKYQAAMDIKALQKEGYFKTVTLDDRNYKLSYTTPPKYATGPARTAPQTRRTNTPKPAASASSSAKAETPKDTASREEELELTYIQPSEPYRPDRNAGKRHEPWMQLPPHSQAVTCHYCGACNAVPLGRRTKYTCYFCREEL